MWRTIHVLAAVWATFFLAHLVWELASTGNIMLPARAAAVPMSTANTLCIALMFVCFLVSAVRAFNDEDAA